MLAWIAVFCVAQDPHPGVDQAKVDAAIDLGVEWLLKQNYKPWDYHDHKNVRFDELVLYTLLHAGIDRTHPPFEKLLAGVLAAELELTYCVGFHAMLLSELDPSKYQGRIAQCGQFLVDNQCDNGQWNYGEPTPLPKNRDVATGGTKSDRSRPKRAIPIQRQRRGAERGDNSNTQVAILGLRACIEANVIPPRRTLETAKRWFETTQNRDGGWPYDGNTASYGSMSAGGTGSLVVLNHYLGIDWRNNKAVAKGIRWVGDNFTVTANAKNTAEWCWHYYFLYAMERVGLLTGMEEFGGHDWYREGANFLLEKQGTDGSWFEGNSHGGPIKDTCLAILFLRRATIPLPKVATGK